MPFQRIRVTLVDVPLYATNFPMHGPILGDGVTVPCPVDYFTIWINQNTADIVPPLGWPLDLPILVNHGVGHERVDFIKLLFSRKQRVR